MAAQEQEKVPGASLWQVGVRSWLNDGVKPRIFWECLKPPARLLREDGEWEEGGGGDGVCVGGELSCSARASLGHWATVAGS